MKQSKKYIEVDGHLFECDCKVIETRPKSNDLQYGLNHLLNENELKQTSHFIELAMLRRKYFNDKGINRTDDRYSDVINGKYDDEILKQHVHIKNFTISFSEVDPHENEVTEQVNLNGTLPAKLDNTSGSDPASSTGQ